MDDGDAGPVDGGPRVDAGSESDAGDGDAGADATTDAGPSICPEANVCYDFEIDGSTPSAADLRGSAVPSTNRPRAGARSLHVMGDGQLGIDSPFFVYEPESDPAEAWVRAYVYAPESARGQLLRIMAAHDSYDLRTGDAADAPAVLDVVHSNRSGVPPEWEGTTEFVLDGAVPRDEWACLELHLDRRGDEATATVYLNGVALGDPVVSPQTSAPETVFVSLTPPRGALESEVWYDDVSAGPERDPCR